jgi:hypothetical protein
MNRGNLLQAWRTARAAYNAYMDGLSGFERAEELLQGVAQAERSYFDALPRIPMGVCPYCDRPLMRSFDAEGFDGLWWRSDATPEEAPSCPHFCVLLGAVAYHKIRPRGGDFDVHPGPEAPYVIPRLLAHPSMVAVISKVPMAPGWTAYPIAYFAERRPKPEDLTAGWARTNFVCTTQLGEHCCKVLHERWDFDLAPWVRKEKVRWQCAPVSRPGQRERIAVYQNHVARRGVA